MSSGASELDEALLVAHSEGNRTALVGLYLQAAEQAQKDAVPFFLTQAWIFALEIGDARAALIEAALVETGHA